MKVIRVKAAKQNCPRCYGKGRRGEYLNSKGMVYITCGCVKEREMRIPVKVFEEDNNRPAVAEEVEA